MGHGVSAVRETRYSPRESDWVPPSGNQGRYGAIVGPKSQFELPPSFRVQRPLLLPSHADVRQNGCSPYFECFDQGNTGSCTAQSMVAALQCAQRKNSASPLLYDTLSPWFLYHYSLLADAEAKMADAEATKAVQLQDIGSTVATAAKQVTFGVCREQLWPLAESAVEQTPSTEAQQDAVRYAGVQVDTLENSLEQLRTCLASGYCFVFSFYITAAADSWLMDRNQQVQSNFIMPGPLLDDAATAGHAVLCVGYEDPDAGGQRPATFTIRNSWGPTWGDQGHFYLTYDTLTNSNWARDFHLIRRQCSQPIGGSCFEALVCPSRYASSVCAAALRL